MPRLNSPSAKAWFCGGQARIDFYIRELFAVVAFGNLLERRTLGRRSLSVEDVHVKDNILAKSYRNPIKLTRGWRICDKSRGSVSLVFEDTAVSWRFSTKNLVNCKEGM